MTAPSSPGQVVAVSGLTKRFGPVTAVNDLSFEVQPGRVTGFLGPNGAGKTTTLRILLGLVRPTSGRATIGGRSYDQLADPLRTVGAALEATGFHPGRSARDHLRVLAATAGLTDQRVDDVLALVGLTDAAARRVGVFSLGMRQRLALAAALLGDPGVLLFDEPANGLDPSGIAWLRGFLRFLAEQGRTVLISSHVLSEVQQTVDDVVIITDGKLVRQASLSDLEGTGSVRVRTPAPAALVEALTRAGLQVAPEPDADPDRSIRSDPADSPESAGSGNLLRIEVDDPAVVGRIAFGAGVELHELTRNRSDLERIFLSLTTAALDGAPPPVAPFEPAPGVVSR
jgi:ABC-2 type transport system ATP-binding protein